MIDWIALNMTPGVGPRAATKLLENFGSAAGVFNAQRSQLESLRIRPESIVSIISRDRHAAAEKEFAELKAKGGDILLLDDGSYPSLLREIADPPITLYVRGAWQECFEQPCVAVIGSRHASTYGKNAAEMLSRDLARQGVCVVSGLARGIDTAAHRGALQAGGRTIAVLGTGFDVVYPKENASLVDEIVAGGGAVVSQFPLGTPPLKDNFPYRNRIISGLSLGVLIVEATEKSGSLITARLASEQNREVMAVPGNITSRNSIGANYLIKAGAKLVQQWQDVVAELPSDIAARLLPPTPEKQSSRRGAAETKNLPADMTAAERKIWPLLSADEPVHIDQLLEQSGLSFGELNTALVALDIKDAIRVLPGKFYALRL